MKFKENMKRFWNVTRNNGGFTLVELIVVIAILAILAGVAIPAYSGYIARANETADEQLLSDLNTAFASACIINGEDYIGRTDSPDITIAADGTVTTTALTTGSQDVNTAFGTFFEGGAFKVYKDSDIKYVPALGAFVKGDVDLTNNPFYNAFNNVSGVDGYVNSINGSAFGDIGADGLVVRLDAVTGLAESLLGSGGNAGNALKGALGADLETVILPAMGMNLEQYAEMMNGMSQEEQDAYTNNLLANYAVLQVAGATAGKDSNTLLNEVKGNLDPSKIGNMVASKDETSSKEGAAQAAMVYAMYTAYANSLPDTDPTKQAKLDSLKDMNTFVNALPNETQEGSGFMDYLNNTDGKGQAAADMEGFIASMNIINSSTQNNPEATRDLLENGYNNQELIDAMQGLLNK